MKATLKIYTKKWARFYKYNACTGKMCALGFLENQLGHLQLGDLSNEWSKLRRRIAQTNDYYKGQERRKILRALFAREGVKVVFV